MASLRSFTRLPLRQSSAAFTQRSFQTATARLAGKETALHNEGRAEEAEKAKQDQLKEQKEGRGQWKEELSSDSESIVKADRGDINASKGTIEQLQRETEKAAKEKR
ncbi:hypothetical protein K490DRAFT_64343 [Saccharata proteae CBS 121410]|uniref:Uncharacterized protein n=1 Tax=Saccharata proteae CBS 121410 TaxID=1314787 RepID=A0A6A5YBQ0_9PEZI|nr:hypothetical protein K490DRAFT_64343 [Saccharata proteae CBS 121410]